MGQKEQNQRQKKIPLRQCLGCNEHKPKKELLRVVRTPEGEIVLDFTGKRSGRGAYICYELKCLKLARKSGRIAKSLEVEIPEDIYDGMERELEENERA
ncbi:MAG: YlxR family protein [Ruminococcaceae bacterium]|nr:YlxR family protein [Oscillospiraceae bacterium]